LDPGLLKAATDAGGWVFAEAATFTGAFIVVRWLMSLLDRQVTATEKLANAVEALTEEVRASRRR